MVLIHSAYPLFLAMFFSAAVMLDILGKFPAAFQRFEYRFAVIE
jgi:hypothetical protein